MCTDTIVFPFQREYRPGSIDPWLIHSSLRRLSPAKFCLSRIGRVFHESLHFQHLLQVLLREFPPQEDATVSCSLVQWSNPLSQLQVRLRWEDHLNPAVPGKHGHHSKTMSGINITLTKQSFKNMNQAWHGGTSPNRHTAAEVREWGVPGQLGRPCPNRTIEQRNINKAMSRPPGYFSVPQMKGGWSAGSTDGLSVLENAGVACHVPRINEEFRGQ